MTAKEILIRIKSFFEGAGVEQAKRGIDAIGESAKKSGDQSKAGFSAAHAGIESVSKGVATLNKLVTGFGLIGLVGSIRSAIAVVSALVDWIGDRMTAAIRRAGEAARQFGDWLSGKKLETAAKIVNDIAAGYDRVERAITASRTASDELAAAWDDLNRAQREITDMETERREKAELAALAPGDAAGRARVSGKYAAIRVETDFYRRGGDAIRAEKSAEDALADARSRRENASGALASAVQARELIKQQVAYSERDANPLYNDDKVSRERAAKELADLSKNLSDLETAIVALNEKIAAAAAQESAAGVRLQAARVRATSGMSAAEALAGQDKADIARASSAAAERDRIEREQEAMRARIAAERQSRSNTQSRLSERAARETAEAEQYGSTAAAMRGRSGYGQANRAYQKERQDMLRAVKAAEDFAAETVRIMQQHEARIRALAEAQKRIPNS